MGAKSKPYSDFIKGNFEMSWRALADLHGFFNFSPCSCDVQMYYSRLFQYAVTWQLAVV